MRSNSAAKHQITALTYILSLLSIILWGMSYIWSNSLLSKGIPVEYIVFVRILLAGIVLLVLNAFTGKKMAIQKNDLPRFLLLALFEPLIYFICETYGIRFTESPTYSSMIIASSPIFSVAAGVMLFKEKISLLNMAGILICIGGIIMVTLCAGTVGSAFWLGMALLLIAVLAEVGHATFTKCLSSRYEPTVIVMYQFLFGSIYLFPLFASRGLADFNAEIYMSWDVWNPILCLAVLCSSIAFSLWANTIKMLGVAKSSIFLATIPVFTAIAGWILGHEYLTKLQWTGILFSCIGVFLSQHAAKRPLFAKHKPSAGSANVVAEER